MKKNRRTDEDTNVSFLDVICCGFGAIILLLMITKTVDPEILEQSVIKLDGQVENLQKRLFSIRGETNRLNRKLNAKHEQISIHNEQVAILMGRLSSLKDQYDLIAKNSANDSNTEKDLRRALQSLSKEMERLLGENYKRKNELIGGIPVDSEYVVFIIDTSGSMFNYAWPKMMQELIATLDIYPQVKGIQVMNDMGDYMFSNYRGKWIPDTPGRRKAIISRLRTWNPFSNSSPVEGIQKAIRSFYSPDKKISLYVFGDEFTGRSIQTVIDTVERLNSQKKDQQRMVRIHAVGFPVQFSRPSHLQATGIRFAALMRELTLRNGGTFVGLNDFREEQ